MGSDETFEFFGPYLGPTGIVFGLPIVCYLLAFLVRTTSIDLWSIFSSEKEFCSSSGALIVFGYFSTVLLLHLALPAKRAKGSLLANGQRLDYRLNGRYHSHLEVSGHEI